MGCRFHKREIPLERDDFRWNNRQRRDFAAKPRKRPQDALKCILDLFAGIDAKERVECVSSENRLALGVLLQPLCGFLY